MKIIHISDTHLGVQANNINFRALVNSIERTHNPADTLIIHTGDLNDRGVDRNQRMGGRVALDGLTYLGYRVLLVPGNHDCGTSSYVDPEACKSFLDTYSPYVFSGSPSVFPVLTSIGDCSFIGLNSNEGEMGWLSRLGAEGCIGVRQLRALDALLDSPTVAGTKIVVYLHHHPFLDAPIVRADVADGNLLSHLVSWNTRRFRRLKDAYSLMRCLQDRIHILLFGHQHFGLDYTSEGYRYGIPLTLDASSSVGASMDSLRMSYRTIDTDSLAYTTHHVPFAA